MGTIAQTHFPAGGGDLVHLVYLVFSVREINHTSYTRTTTHTSTASRSPRILAIRYQPYALLFMPADQYHHHPTPRLAVSLGPS